MLSRRLNREFKNINYEISDDINNKIITFMHQDIKIKVKICQDYPFKKPQEIYLNNRLISHEYYFDLPTNVKKRLYKRLDGICCLMCESYLCSDNWSPSLTIIDSVNQILKYREIIVQAHYAEYTLKYGLIPLLPELIDRILDYV